MTRPYLFALALILAAGCSRPVSEPTVQPDVARGRLLSLNRRLLPRCQVRITGCPDQVTALDGTFDTRCAAQPYDLAATIGNVGIVYQGLTRPDPVVTIPVVVSADGSSYIHGNVVGRTDGRDAGVAITSSAASSEVIGLGVAPHGLYSSYALWLDTSPSATVRGLEWTGTLNGPTAFTAYGAVTVPLVAGIDPIASPTLEPIANGAVSLTIDARRPEGAEVHLWAEWPEGGVTRLARFWAGTPHMTVPTPDVPGVVFTAVVVDDEHAETSSGFTSGWRRGLAANATPDPIVLPTAAAFTAPAAESLVDLTTDFTYTAVPGAVYLVAFESGVRADPQYYVVTRATTARIPDLGWAGVPPLRSGYTSYRTASVTAVGPFASVDAAAAGPGSVMPDHWAWEQPFEDNLPAEDGFATRHRMYIRAW